MRKFARSINWASNGLKAVWHEERNFRIEVVIGALVIIASLLLDFTPFEIALIVLAVTLVLTAEILNTAIEDLATKVEPNEDPVIGKIKDIMAAFVLVAAIGAAVIGVIVFLNRFS